MKTEFLTFLAAIALIVGCAGRDPILVDKAHTVTLPNGSVAAYGDLYQKGSHLYTKDTAGKFHREGK